MLDTGGVEAILTGSDAQGAFLMAEMYTIGGYQFTTWHTDLGGYTAVGTAVQFRGSKKSLGTSPATYEIFIAVDGATNGLIAAATAKDAETGRGAFDEQPFRAERWYAGTGSNGTPTAGFIRFSGKVMEVHATSLGVGIMAGDVWAELEGVQVGRIISGECPYVYGSAPCGHGGGGCNHTLYNDGGAGPCKIPQNFGGFPDAPRPVTSKK